MGEIGETRYAMEADKSYCDARSGVLMDGVGYIHYFFTVNICCDIKLLPGW